MDATLSKTVCKCTSSKRTKEEIQHEFCESAGWAAVDLAVPLFFVDAVYSTTHLRKCGSVHMEITMQPISTV